MKSKSSDPEACVQKHAPNKSEVFQKYDLTEVPKREGEKKYMYTRV